MTPKTVLSSLSAAMDGGFVAIVDVSAAIRAAGAADAYRLIGGVTVMLHVERLGLELPLRATGDAGFGVPPYVLRKSRQDLRRQARPVVLSATGPGQSVSPCPHAPLLSRE